MITYNLRDTDPGRLHVTVFFESIGAIKCSRVNEKARIEVFEGDDPDFDLPVLKISTKDGVTRWAGPDRLMPIDNPESRYGTIEVGRETLQDNSAERATTWMELMGYPDVKGQWGLDFDRLWTEEIEHKCGPGGVGETYAAWAKVPSRIEMTFNPQFPTMVSYLYAGTAIDSTQDPNAGWAKAGKKTSYYE